MESSANQINVTNRKKPQIVGFDIASQEPSSENEDGGEQGSNNNNNNNNNNDNIDSTSFEYDVSEFITDEGIKSQYGDVWALLIKYQKAFDVKKKSHLLTMIAVICIVIIFSYVLLYVIPVSLFGKHTINISDADNTKHVAPPPIDFTVIVDFSEDQLRGITSGRLNQWFFEMKYTTIKLMHAREVKCATPWLVLPNLGPTNFYNLLVIDSNNSDNKNDNDTPTFINVHDITMNKSKGSSLTTSVPFKFKSNKTSRHYFNELTFKHSAGRYTTASKEEAFCIQELYALSSSSTSGVGSSQAERENQES